MLQARSNFGYGELDVPKANRPKSGVASPLTLPSFDPDDADLLVVIIETQKGVATNTPSIQRSAFSA
jgi:hypothetical protein